MVEITVKTFEDACILMGVLNPLDANSFFTTREEDWLVTVTDLDIDQFKSDCDKIGFTEYELTEIK